jgi:hypothetical protein
MLHEVTAIFLLTIQHRHFGEGVGVGRGQLCHQMIFPSYERFLFSFLPPFIRFLLPSRITILQFLPSILSFAYSTACFFPSFFSLVFPFVCQFLNIILFSYSLVLSTFPWLGFSLVWHRVLVMLSQLYRLHCTHRFLPRSFTFYNAISVACIAYSRRFRWPSGLRWGSAAARLLGLRVRITPGVWTTVSWECYQVQVSGTSQSLVQRRHSNCGVSLCDVGTSSTRGSWHA